MHVSKHQVLILLSLNEVNHASNTLASKLTQIKASICAEEVGHEYVHFNSIDFNVHPRNPLSQQNLYVVYSAWNFKSISRKL